MSATFQTLRVNEIEQLSCFSKSLYTLVEGNDNPLQYSCLENPMDWGAWWATVHGVTRVRHELAPPGECKRTYTQVIRKWMRKGVRKNLQMDTWNSKAQVEEELAKQKQELGRQMREGSAHLGKTCSMTEAQNSREDMIGTARDEAGQ